jgi:alkylation response protein AidB-like acyl-CoA dehydrogenase
MQWPEAYGGRDATPMQQAIVSDEMARAGAPPAINGLGVGFIGPTIIVHGTEWQKQRYLKKILTAEEIWCQLYSEPNAGSDLASLKTRAEDQGDHFVVNGQKIWTSSGPIADWGLLLCRTDPTVPKHKGISCVLLNMRQPGVEVRPLKQLTGHSLFSEVFMTNARAEKVDLVGRPGQGWEIAQTTLGYERGANSLGRVTRYTIAFNQLVKAAKALRRDGRPLIENAAVRARMGRIYAELEVQRYAALRVLSALNKGDSPGAASSITKLSYSEFEKRYYELAQEVLGPYGQVAAGAPEPFLTGVDSSSGVRATWAYGFLWSRAGTIYAGSSEIQKNVIGERVLGLPKEIRADRRA